jgi:hypothetical protein
VKLDSSSRIVTRSLIVGVVLLFSADASSGGRVEPLRRDLASLQRLIDQLRLELRITAPVAADIVASNPLLVSVERQPRQARHSAFAIAFDRDFLDSLDDDDVRAAIAHELGHVWIFTHHPYLQTERLANDVAMRAVSRESLLRVYEKVWARAGTRGDPISFVGGQ